MFTCERCGSGYSASHIGVEHCPRCLLLDRVQTPLAFKVFNLPETRAAKARRRPLSNESPPSVRADAP